MRSATLASRKVRRWLLHLFVSLALACSLPTGRQKLLPRRASQLRHSAVASSSCKQCRRASCCLPTCLLSRRLELFCRRRRPILPVAYPSRRSLDLRSPLRPALRRPRAWQRLPRPRVPPWRWWRAFLLNSRAEPAATRPYSVVVTFPPSISCIINIKLSLLVPHTHTRIRGLRRVAPHHVSHHTAACSVVEGARRRT